MDWENLRHFSAFATHGSLAGTARTLGIEHATVARRIAALERREADIAIRLSRPEEGDLTIMKLGVMSFRLYASPAYLEHTPEPQWTFIGYDGPMASAPQQMKLREIAADRRIAFLPPVPRRYSFQPPRRVPASRSCRTSWRKATRRSCA